jgi:hypothetical protein
MKRKTDMLQKIANLLGVNILYLLNILNLLNILYLLNILLKISNSKKQAIKANSSQFIQTVLLVHQIKIYTALISNINRNIQQNYTIDVYPIRIAL